MVGREKRVKDMTRFSRITQRDLERDRLLLDRHEHRLLTDVKRLIRKNDLHNARLVATQIAVYRRLVERKLRERRHHRYEIAVDVIEP